MRTKSFVAAVAAGLMAYTSAALAHELDTDQDGLYSLAELQAEYPDLTQLKYDALDINKDGAVDAAEFDAAVSGGVLPSAE